MRMPLPMPRWFALLLLIAFVFQPHDASARRRHARRHGGHPPVPVTAPAQDHRPSERELAFADTLEHRTFQWFWDKSDAATGLTPDRAPAKSFVSVAAMGFSLSAWPIGIERLYITRDQGIERTLNALRWLMSAPQDTSRMGASGYRGFYYHFLDTKTGTRWAPDVELSTQDTALLLGGVLFASSYFDHGDPREVEIRALADSIYRRVDFAWAQNHKPLLTLGWFPETGFLPYDWGGLNETVILHLLAMGSPTHGCGIDLWRGYQKHYVWDSFQGVNHLCFPPLFGHQYTHCWVDFRGIQDDAMRLHATDFFKNSQLATESQYRYAVANPMGWKDYGGQMWGITACDGPIDTVMSVNGLSRQFHTYAGRGVSVQHITDDGTIAPTAAAGSMPFRPEIALPALVAMRERFGENVFNEYGFVDAFNPTLTDTLVPVRMGRIVAGVGWFDTDQLGIDQGPILMMIENWRSGLVWRVMRRNPYVQRGLEVAGFRGGWLAMNHAQARAAANPVRRGVRHAPKRVAK